MWKLVIRTGAVVVSIAATMIYAGALYLASFACYGLPHGCGAGWVARTAVTGAYLALIAAGCFLTRWLLRMAQAHEDKRRDGVL